MNADVFVRGFLDYNDGRCLVYRNVQGKLVWDSDYENLDEPEVWAKSYIAGYDAAAANAEKDANAMCAK